METEQLSVARPLRPLRRAAVGKTAARSSELGFLTQSGRVITGPDGGSAFCAAAIDAPANAAPANAHEIRPRMLHPRLYQGLSMIPRRPQPGVRF